MLRLWVPTQAAQAIHEPLHVVYVHGQQMLPAIPDQDGVHVSYLVIYFSHFFISLFDISPAPGA